MKNQDWKNLIAEGKIENTIDELLKYTSNDKNLEELNDILILQKSLQIDNEKNHYLKNIIPPDEYRINRARVINSLLKIIREIESLGSEVTLNNQKLEKVKKDVLKDTTDNYVLVFGRDTVGKTAFISTIAKEAEGVFSMDEWTEGFRYFPKPGKDDLMEVNFSMRNEHDESIDINIIEMPDDDLKEVLLFREDEKDKIHNRKLSRLYILMTDAESGDKDDFIIAMFIKLLCENLNNLSFIIVISKWDIISERKFNWYHYDRKSAYDYVKKCNAINI